MKRRIENRKKRTTLEERSMLLCSGDISQHDTESNQSASESASELQAENEDSEEY